MSKLQELKLGVYEKAIPLQLSWPEKFRVAKQAGFDFIELSIDGRMPRIDRLNWTGADLDAIRRASEAEDMPFYTMALTANRFFPLGSPDAELRGRGQSIVRQAVNIAGRLGVRAIQLAPYDVGTGEPSTPETRENLFRSLNEVLKYAERNGVTLALEVMPDVPFIMTVRAAKGIIDRFDSPYLQIYTDLGNVAAMGTDPAPDLPSAGRHVIACHVKDATPGCFREIPFGEGIVDFDRCFQALGQMDYNGLLIAEMWSNEEEGFIPYLKTAADFIRSKMQAADEKNSQ